MQFTPQTFSRAELQSLPAKHRAEMATNIVNQHINEILTTAKSGGTSYLFKSFSHAHNTGLKQFPSTTDELVEAFKNKFPGCNVEYMETWEEVRTGVKEQKRVIKIDWS